MLTEGHPNYMIEHYVNGLLFLFHHPNVESRINPHVSPSPQKYAILARESLRGKSVHGMNFPCQVPHTLTREEKLETFLVGFDSPGFCELVFDNQLEEFSLQEVRDYVTKDPLMEVKLNENFPFYQPCVNKGFEVSLLSGSPHGNTGLTFIYFVLSSPSLFYSS